MKHSQVKPVIELPEGEERRRVFLGIESASFRRFGNWPLIQFAKNNSVSFGLSMLDRALIGILPTDLVVLGASPGVGKSTMALEIAKNIAMKKKRVLYVALEAEQNEIEMRLQFQLFVSKYLYDPNRDRGVIFDFRRYRFGQLDDVLRPYAEDVNRLFGERYETLETYYKKEDFTIEHLRQLLIYAKDAKFHCIIIDHLHYFDLYGGSAEKNEELATLMHQIRNLNLHYQIPIILVAHLRKHQNLIPTLSDFHGTSEIGKIATTCLMLSPRPGSYNAGTSCVDTIISVPKVRAGGKLNVVGLMQFHTQLSAYLPEYRVGREDGGDIEELRLDQLPYWAKGDSFCKSGAIEKPDEHY